MIELKRSTVVWRVDNTSLPFLTLKLPQGQKNIKGGLPISRAINHSNNTKSFGEKVNIISNSTQEQDVAEERNT